VRKIKVYLNVLNRFVHLLILIILMIVSCASSKTEESDKIIGRSNITDWILKSGWDDTLYRKTGFSDDEIKKFRSLSDSKGLRFVIFASSTCLECSQSLPYFFKLLIESNIEDNRINLYGLDDYWEEPSGIFKKYKITEVPIVFIESDSGQIILTKKEFTDITLIINKIEGM